MSEEGINMLVTQVTFYMVTILQSRGSIGKKQKEVCKNGKLLNRTAFRIKIYFIIYAFKQDYV